ncbi:MAG: hypothetical protein A2W05_09070 [Candidatus Schekmanbacteria bacterium RBG_16_38_10]|uniref:DUF5683 domain-containing protein n=1 Tax=Candidatus Schekmanbacteria bacterium RBG_16_38_10 TaxID=1817879 RepID=A0A1F7S1T5_9BACT|nr:MAG: hypothetical protein A2W05_09070 [Candidatus Schekmanbacteria bacterium RBG_16_38_10]
MKKFFIIIIIVLLCKLLTPLLTFAAETEERLQDDDSNSSPSAILKEDEKDIFDEKELSKRGGFRPCVYSLCLGPRIGLEYNEGRKARSSEKICLIPFFGWAWHIMNAYDAYKGKGMSEVVAEEGLDE